MNRPSDTPDRPFTLVQLLPALHSGGVEQGTLEVAAAVARRGGRSIVISGGGRMVERLRDEGSEHIRWSIGAKRLSTLFYIPRLRRLLTREKVDLLHARSRLPAWIGLLAWRGMRPETRPKFITTAHGLYSVKYYSSIMARGEAVIAVSQTVADYLTRHYPDALKAPPSVIPRGVDEHRYRPDFQPDEGWQRRFLAQFPQLRGRKLLVLPGRLTRLKGHLPMLAMLCRLRDHRPDFHTLIVGGEDPRRLEYARSLRRYVDEHQLGQWVTFTGIRDDLREILASARIAYSLSTHPESFGRTTLEALSLGTPVIGFDHGGVREILLALQPEGLVPVGDEDALLQRSIDFLREPPTPLPNHQFTTQRMLDRTLELYAQLSGRGLG